jgi:DNA-binding CsgD family transcriptional regulator/tetratricopeptide (TPR) repeat protein
MLRQPHNSKMTWAAPLMGRSVEMAELEREYHRALAGEFRCVLLLADAGIGKTRLAREFLARRRGTVTALPARAYPLGETAAFGVWSEALEGHLRLLRPSEVSELCGGFLDDLAALIRSVAAVRGSAPLREPPRIRALEGLAHLLGNLARRRPLVIFLDDAHVADASSWEALKYLAHNLHAQRLLVLAAARPSELAENETGTDVLLGLEQEGALQRRHLRPLDGEALGDLAQAVLEEVPPRPLVDWLADHSRGNPLFALGLLQALIDEGADLSAPVLHSIPEELAERVGQRMHRLDERELAALEALATAQGRVELHDLVALTGLPIKRLAVGLEELVRLRMVAEGERGRELTYEIAHPLIQHSIYERIGLARRRGMHRRIARVLLESGRLAEAAPHFAQSAAIGDDEAIQALRNAVQQAESREAYREALTILGVLVELIPAGDHRWLDVLHALSWRAEWVVDHRADTHALLGIKAMKAIDVLLADSPDPAPRATVKFRLAQFLGWGSGDLDEAERACAAGRSLFERAGDGASVLLADNELAWIHGLRGDYAAMEAGGKGVGEAAQAIGDSVAAIQGLHTMGHAAWIRGRFAEGEAALLRSNAIAREEHKIYRLTVGLISLATCFAVQGRVEEARSLLDEAKAANPGWRDSILPEWESIVQWFAGDFRSALTRAQEAAAERVGELSKRRVIGVVFAALAAVEAGQPSEARRHLARARRAIGDREWQFFTHACAHAEGILAWQEGNTAEALAGMRHAPARILRTGAQPFAAVVLLDLAELAAELGDAAVAADAAGELAKIAERIDGDLYLAMAMMGSAWSELAADGSNEGVAPARRAVELLSDSGCRAFRARALELLGRSLIGNDRVAAVNALEKAAMAFDACGAVWRRDRAADRLRTLGARGRRAAAAVGGPFALSRRERQIARLAVKGQTAREIAKQLFISERTVESHLASAYGKLGVRSKLDLVRRASEFPLNR